MNRAEALRIAACALLGLGAALLVAALLLSTYTVDKITKIPLDIDTALVSDGTATALDPASLSTPRFVIDKDVPVSQQQQVTTEAPSNAEVVTLQVGTTVRRTDKQKDNGLLLAMVDTVTLDRKTALAVSSENNPGGAVQKPRTIDDKKPPTSVVLAHEGLNYRFPFDVEKQTYPYFDPIAQKAFDANYDGEEDVLGLTTYRFKQNVGFDAAGKLVEPVRYPSLYDRDDDGVVRAPAALWGFETDAEDDLISMARFYAAQREFWVDPVSGVIVKTKEHALHYYSRCEDEKCDKVDPLKVDVTLTDYTVTSNEATVESQVTAANDTRDQVSLWSRVLPITFTALGVVLLIAGGLLGVFGLKAQSALADKDLDEGDHGYYNRGPSGEPVPGAEAKTEKLPAARPLGHDSHGKSGKPAPPP